MSFYIEKPISEATAEWLQENNQPYPLGYLVCISVAKANDSSLIVFVNIYKHLLMFAIWLFAGLKLKDDPSKIIERFVLEFFYSLHSNTKPLVNDVVGFLIPSIFILWYQ